MRPLWALDSRATWHDLGPAFGLSWTDLGTSWVCPRHACCRFGQHWDCLSLCWVCLGPVLGCLELFWAFLGLPWVCILDVFRLVSNCLGPCSWACLVGCLGVSQHVVTYHDSTLGWLSLCLSCLGHVLNIYWAYWACLELAWACLGPVVSLSWDGLGKLWS